MVLDSLLKLAVIAGSGFAVGALVTWFFIARKKK
jgi:hypothetical protein